MNDNEGMATPLTEEQRNRLLLVGDAARETLGNQGVSLALTAVQQETIKTLFTTDPKEVRRREDLYFMVRATTEVIAMLHAWVRTADQLRASEEADATNDTEE